METHLQDRQARKVVIHNAGNFPLVWPAVAVADQSQIHLFLFA